MSKPSTKDWKLYNNLTILDFADAGRTCKRVPKGKLRVKDLTRSNQIDDGITNADFEEDPAAVEDSSVHKNQHAVQDTEHVYNDYQYDVWFLISEHVQPEDICRFASICQKTRYVVSTAKFWFHLYRKYYNRKIDLPVCLQPEFMERRCDLRARVIRFLFHVYPPFVQQIRTSPDLATLLKFKCIAVWYRRVKDYWTLCFKFSRNYLGSSQLVRQEIDEGSEVDSWEDIEVVKLTLPPSSIHTNLEEGNRILVVTTERFYPPPDFMAPNLLLSKIIQPLSQNLRTFKLELTFSEYNGKIVGNVSYDPVRNCKIIRWWEPEYYSLLG